MTLIACVDPRGGLNFNHRRQSRDRIVCEHILNRCQGSVLRTSPYSMNMLSSVDVPSQILASDDFLEEAAPEDFCFVELESEADLSRVLDRVNQVILYVWDKPYPFSNRFPDIQNHSSWKLIEAGEFVGYSHEKMTEEIYEKV